MKLAPSDAIGKHNSVDESELFAFNDLPKARSSTARLPDRSTSFEAAADIPAARVTRTKRAIISTLQLAGVPLTHEQLYERVSRSFAGIGTAQSVRSRTAELVRAGLVIAVDEDGTSPTGRRATRWGLPPRTEVG